LGEFVFVVETVLVAVEGVGSARRILDTGLILFIDIVDPVTVTIDHQHARPHLGTVNYCVVITIRIGDALRQLIAIPETIKIAVR